MRKLRFFGILSANLLLAGLVLTACSGPYQGDVSTVQGAAIHAFNPDYEGITFSGFRIKSSTAAAVSTSPNTGQTAEYAVSKNSTAPVTGWQAGLEFTGLDANTLYYVWARSGAKETSTVKYESGTAVKGEKTVKTTANARGLLDTLNGLKAGAAGLDDDSTVILTGKVALDETLEIEQGVALIIDNTAAELDAKGFEIIGDGRLEVSTGTLKAENGKIGVDTVFKPGAKYVRMSGTPRVSETIIGAGGNMEFENAPSPGSAINLCKNGDGYEYFLSGSAIIKSGKTFTLEPDDSFYTEEGAALTVNGTLNVENGGKLIIDGTIDIAAEKWTGSCASIALNGSGTFIVPSGADAGALNVIITDIKEIDRGADPDYSGNVVIRLTNAFYTTETEDYIVVDSGAVENEFPYTIRGLGKDVTDDLNNNAIPKLNAGMWLANNNVTLEDISFTITTTKGLVPARPWTESAQGDVTDAYGVAVLIARTKEGDGGTGDYLGGNKNVTVQNCAIDIKGGTGGEKFTGGIWVYGSPEDIRILENTVIVTGKEDNAAQALAFDAWGDNIKIKNNKLSSKYANQPDLSDPDAIDFYSTPASAFYIRKFSEKSSSVTYKYNTGDISGNTLSYDPEDASVFSFYIRAFPNSLPETTSGSRKGVEAMGNKKFGDPETSWVINTAAAGDYHRMVVGDLISDCKANGKGFGAVLMYVSYKNPGNIDDNNIETYKIDDEKLTNIGICAWKLMDGDYVYNEDTVVEGNVTVNADGTTIFAAGDHMRYWH